MEYQDVAPKCGKCGWDHFSDTPHGKPKEGTPMYEQEAVIARSYVTMPCCGRQENLADARCDLHLAGKDLMEVCEFAEAGPIAAEGANTPEAMMRWAIRLREMAKAAINKAKA